MSAHSSGYNFGTVRIKPMEFVDDIADPSREEASAIASNSVLGAIQHEKRISFSAEKSELLKINCNNSDGFKVNGTGIKVVESARYLGDLFNIKGDNSVTCGERHLQAKGTSVELCSLSGGLSFGIRQIESMLILYKTVFVPRLIYSCEAWSNLKAADYKSLQSAQLKFMRKILEVPRSTPTAALYIELGIWPIRYEIEIRQLFFLKRVLNKREDDPCLLVYLEVLKFEDETNWGNEVLGLRKKYNLPLKDENIKNMSERDWKSIVKSSVYREAFLQLQVELSMNRKTSHLSYIVSYAQKIT